MSAATTTAMLDIVRLSAAYLATHGSDSSRLDAELLVAHALGLRRIDLYLQFDRTLGDAQVSAVRELLRRRGRGEPVAYLTGVREFFSRGFRVSPDVLVPRPETETVVQAALGFARGRSSLAIADLGTGSGCIAVTLAAEIAGARVVAVDTSAAALDVARDNAKRHGVSDRVEFVQGSWGDALSAPFDVVVSNPPYVTHAELAAASRDVREFEPHAALDGGADGLDAYRALLGSLPSKLSEEALVALEVDPRRAATVEAMVRQTLPGCELRILDDLARAPRVVTAARRRVAAA